MGDAARVVAVDIDGSASERTAEAIGGNAVSFSFAGDVTDRER
jgi:hypothetical protein